jgi:hypothetical protein
MPPWASSSKLDWSVRLFWKKVVFMNPWFAAGATAAVMSERSRNVLRRGIVYGLAGVLTVGEGFVSAAKGIAHGAEHVATSAGDMAGDLIGEAREVRHAAEEAKPEHPKRERARPQAKEGAAQ